MKKKRRFNGLFLSAFLMSVLASVIAVVIAAAAEAFGLMDFETCLFMINSALQCAALWTILMTAAKILVPLLMKWAKDRGWFR